MGSDPAELIAAELDRRGLATPARVLADAHRPLAPLLADAASFLGPLLSAIGGRSRAAGELLRAPDGLDRLIRALDADAGPTDREPDDGATQCPTSAS